MIILTISVVNASEDVDNLTVSDNIDNITHTDEINLIAEDDSNDNSVGDGKVDIDYRIHCDDQIAGPPFEGEWIDYNGFIGVEFYDYPQGNLTIYIDDNIVYNKTVEPDCYFWVYDANLTIGTHTATFKYSGSDYYNPFETTDTFEYYYIRDLTPDVLVIGKDCFGVSLSKDAGGFLTLLIDNIKVFEAEVDNYREEDAENSGVYIQWDDIENLSSLTLGEHSYKIIYSNGKYPNKNFTGTVNLDYVFEVETYDLEENYTYYGKTLKFEICTPEEGQINVTLIANGKNYTVELENSEYTNFEFNDLKMGENNLTFICNYMDYSPKSQSFIFNVLSQIIVPDDFSYNGDELISLILPSDANGNLIVYNAVYDSVTGEFVKGTVIKSTPLNNGVANISLADLNIGEYDIIASYDGQDYVCNDVYRNFNINPKLTYEKYVWRNGTYTVRIDVSNNTGARLTVILKSEDYWDVHDHYFPASDSQITLYNGSAKTITLNLPLSLMNDTYWNINVDYIDVTGRFSNSGTFFLMNDAPNWNMEVDFPNVLYKEDFGENWYITNIPDGMEHGKAILYIDGKKYGGYDWDSYDGFDDENCLDVSELTLGTHTWKLTFVDRNGYYNNASASGTFKVISYNRIDNYTYMIDVGDYLTSYYSYYGSISLPAGAEGYINVTVDNLDTITRNVYGGYAYFYLDKSELAIGKHNITIVYSGDDIYEGFTYQNTFNVADIIIKVPNFIAKNEYSPGDLMWIRVTQGIRGNIVTYIDGEEVINGPIEKSIEMIDDDEYIMYGVVFDITDYSFGNHTYNITYTGQDYNVTKSGSFNIGYFLHAYVEAYSEDNLPYGKNITLCVTLPADANSLIHILLNGQSFEYQSTGSSTDIILKDLVYGKNNLTVTYYDDKYPEQSYNLDLYVKGLIEIPNTVIYNDGQVISLSLPEDAVGKLCIYEQIYNETTYETTSQFIASTDIVNGSATIDISTLDIGRHGIIAYVENGNYEVDECYDSVEVCPKVTYTPGVHVNQNANFVVELPDSSTGNLTIEIYKVKNEYSEEIIATYNNQFNISLNTSEVGVYSIRLEYGSLDKNYKFYVFNTNKEWDLIVEAPSQLLYNDYGSIDVVYWPDNLNGYFVLYVDGKKVEEYHCDPFFRDYDMGIRAKNYAMGQHSWELKYYGDSYYNNASQNGTFNIVWAKVYDIIEIGGDSQYIDVLIPYVNEADIFLYLDDELYSNGTLSDGQISFYLDNLTQGKVYRYTITCPELNLTTNGTFTVSYAISTRINNYDDGDYIAFMKSYNLTVTLPDDATGFVTVSAGGKNYTGVVNDGIAVISLPLSWGENILTVAYSGNDKYASKELNKRYVVNEIEIVGNYSDEYLVSASILLPSNDDGYLVVYVDWEEFKRVSIVNGSATISLDDCPIGCYEIQLRYLFSSAYDEAYLEGYVSILPNMTIPQKINYGEDCNIIIELPNATSTMDVSVDGVLNGTYDLIDGKYYNITIPNLTKGNHFITFNYNGGDYKNPLMKYIFEDYNYSPISFNIEVFDYPDANLTIDVENIDLGNDAVISFTINENATGYLIVNVYEVDLTGIVIPGFENNNTYNKTFQVEIQSGTAILTIPNLVNSGKYNIIATYEGNEFVKPANITHSFNVLEDANLTAQFQDIEVGQNFIVNISMNYKESVVTFTTVEIKITPSNSICPSIFINKGKGQANITDLEMGEYKLSIIFNGDDYYKAATFNSTFKVLPKYEDANLTVEVNNITQGENATVTVTMDKNANGNLIVTILNQTQKITINNMFSPNPGIYNFNFTNLPAGTHDVIINYTGTPLNNLGNGSGSIYYKPVVITTSIYVKPIPVSANLTANANDIYEGQNATVTVLINESITGNVTINIDGNDKLINIINGEGKYTIPNLTPGQKEFTIKFAGDEFFLPDQTTIQFNVKEKENSNLNVNTDFPEVYEGKTINITVSINENVTGAVTINVDGVDKIISIVNGKGSYVLSGLAAGSYNYTVSFAGDERFNEDSKVVSVKVLPKSDAGLAVSAGDVIVGNDVTVNVLINENVTGAVTINVDGVDKVISIVNGKGSYVLSGLAVGSYNYTVSFAGDDKFIPDSKQVLFKVNAKLINPDLTINVANITEGENAVVFITTNKTFSGNVTVKVNSKDYIVAVVNGAGNISISNLAVGAYTASAIFAPTEIFEPSVKSVAFKVNKKADVVSLKLPKVKVKKSKKVSISVTLKINGVAAAGKKITLKFGKKKFYKNTNSKGIAKITIKKSVTKKLKVNKKVTYQAIYGKTVVKRTVKVKK